jgi:hypothetical protein
MTKLFSVVEYASYFAVRHNPTGLEKPMGDGVDTLFDVNGKSLVPGTPGFTETWEAMLNDWEDTLEAYFPELLPPVPLVEEGKLRPIVEFDVRDYGINKLHNFRLVGLTRDTPNGTVTYSDVVLGGGETYREAILDAKAKLEKLGYDVEEPECLEYRVLKQEYPNRKRLPTEEGVTNKHSVDSYYWVGIRVK